MGKGELTFLQTGCERNTIAQQSAKLNDGVTKEEKLGINLIRWHGVQTLGCTEPVCNQCDRGGVGALMLRLGKWNKYSTRLEFVIHLGNHGSMLTPFSKYQPLPLTSALTCG
jgi:hypothetical protein